MSDKIRVLIADDLEAVHKRLSRQLSERPELQIVGEVGKTKEIIPAIKQLEPDILLLDLKWRFSDLAGLNVLEQIRQARLPVKVLLVTSHLALLEQDPQRRHLADKIVPSWLTGSALVAEIQSLMSLPKSSKQKPITLWSLLGYLAALLALLAAIVVAVASASGVENLGIIVSAAVALFLIIVFVALFYLRRINFNQLAEALRRFIKWKP